MGNSSRKESPTSSSLLQGSQTFPTNATDGKSLQVGQVGSSRGPNRLPAFNPSTFQPLCGCVAVAGFAGGVGTGFVATWAYIQMMKTRPRPRATKNQTEGCSLVGR